jgi:PAS domain S-box-containing protein
VSAGRRPTSEDAERIFEDAPCGLLITAPDGTIVRVNRTFESWTSLDRRKLIGNRRLVDLLPAAGRIYHETHFAPLLALQGSVSEIALEIVRADGSRLPALVNATVGGEGESRLIRIAIFEAAERRNYEEELLRVRREEHEIALRLQRSMLSGALPSAPGLEVSATYRPAVENLEIGGDWYDAYRLDGRRIAMVVGDVVGRGIEAAAAMGQLRSATRAVSATGLAPARVLEALDDYARLHEVGRMATVVYVEVDLEAPAIRYACAGHLPPVLVEAAGEPRLLWEGRSPPLAFRRRDGRERPEGSCDLGSAATVLLYTDGLIERRDRSIDHGEQRLLDAVRAHAGERPGPLTRNLLGDLLDDGESADDACVLAAWIGVEEPD